MKQNIKKYKTLIILSIILLCIGVILMLFKNTKDFALNFLTEMIGIIITIFVIDNLIQKQKEVDNIPIRTAIYEEIRVFINRYISFWVDAFRSSVPEKDPENIKNFFSENGMHKIFTYLDLESYPNVTPKMNWFSWLKNNITEFKNSGNIILNKYSLFLKPNIIQNISYLTSKISFNSFILMIDDVKSSDNESNFKRAPILSYYCPKPRNEDYNSIINLIEWCDDEYLYLKNNNKDLVNNNYKYKPLDLDNKNIKSKISKDILEELSEKNYAKHQDEIDN